MSVKNRLARFESGLWDECVLICSEEIVYNAIGEMGW